MKLTLKMLKPLRTVGCHNTNDLGDIHCYINSLFEISVGDN